MTDKNIQDILPLLPAQQGMVFQTMASPDKDNFVVFLAMELSGPLVADVFEYTWHHVIAHHDTLRTGFFRLKTRSPVQVVFRSVAFAVEHLDWTETADSDAAIDALKDDIRAQGFAFGQAPLMRLHLIKKGPSDWVMLWSYYHAILDGASVLPVLQRVMATYAALAKTGELPPIDCPPLADYVRWQKSQHAEAAEAFWRRELDDVNEAFVTDLELSPVLENGQPVRSEHRCILNEAEQEKVQGFARGAGVTIANLMSASWALVLSRFSGSDTVLFGAVQLGRDAHFAAPEQMTGCFIQTIPVRVNCAPDATVLDWLQEQQKAAADRMAHSHLGFARIRRCAPVPENQTLFGTLLVVQPMPSDAMQDTFADLSIRHIKMDESTDSPITAYAVVGKQIELKLAGIGLAPDDLDRALQYWREALVSLCGAPQTTVSQLTLTPAWDRDILNHLSGWAKADAHREAPDIIETIWMRANELPDAIAVHDLGGGQSYHDLVVAADRIAGHLKSKGVEPGQTVAMMLSRKWHLVAAILGVMRAGAVVVPIDPQYPEKRRAFIVSDATPKVLIHDMGAIDTDWNLKDCAVAEIDDVLDQNVAQRTFEMPAIEDGHPAYIIYTSGSTGTPKGVVLSRRNIARFAAWAKETYDRDDLAYVVAGTSVCFDLSIFEVFVPLSVGGTIILCDTILSLPNHPQCNSARLINTVPSATEALLAAGLFPETVTTLNLAGEPLKRETVTAIHAQTQVRQLRNLYGPSECTVYATAETLAKSDAGKPLIGRPIAGTFCVILDPHGRLTPIGAAGELYLGGAGVSIGYWQREDMTSDRFIEKPVLGLGHQRLYKTGDLVRWRRIEDADYRLEYLNRKDRLIKLNGFRIEPGEIEALLRKHQNVADIAVCQSTLADNHILRAFVVPKANSDHGANGLPEWLRDRLPSFMVPSHFEVVETLPLTLNGKTDYKALADQPLTFAAPEERSANVSAIESRIAAIWKDILGLEAVPHDRGFFEVGGTSLSLLGVHNALIEAGFEGLQTVDLLNHTSISALAGYLENHQAPPAQESISAVKKRVAARRQKAARQRRRTEEAQ